MRTSPSPTWFVFLWKRSAVSRWAKPPFPIPSLGSTRPFLSFSLLLLIVLVAMFARSARATHHPGQTAPPPRSTRKRRKADVDNPPPPMDESCVASDDDLPSNSAMAASNHLILDQCEASASPPLGHVRSAPTRQSHRHAGSPTCTRTASIPVCPGEHEDAHSHHKDHNSSGPKQSICAGCKDMLHQFFVSGLQKGHSPAVTGAYLWSILHKRQQNKSEPDSTGCSSSSIDESSSACVDESNDDIPSRRHHSVFALQESSDEDG